MSRSKSACPLFELPQELLESVLSYLLSSQDVSNLSRTCKALHAKTVEHLYSNISMEWQVVQAIRPLTVAGVDVSQALRPNLVSLDLGFHIGDDVVYLPEILWKLSSGGADSQALGCRKLRNVHLGHVHIASEEEQPSDRWSRVKHLHPHLDWRGYWAFFWCPNIQKIEMSLMDETALTGFQKAVSLPVCSTLTTLRLGESSVKPDTLAKLLSCTPALRRLDYEYWVRDQAFITVDCASLSAALNSVKSTLEHLRFFCQMHSPGSVDVFGKCNFRDYPVLSSLHVPPAVILGGDASLWSRIEEVMPSSLEELCFVDDDLLEFWSPKELIPLLDDFFQGDWRARTPKLRRVYATDNKSWLDAYGTDYLRMLSEQNGLECGKH